MNVVGLGWRLALARAFASLVLGLLVFLGLLYVVVLTNFSSKLLDDEFYSGILADADAYDRVYAELLAEFDLADESPYFGGDNWAVLRHDLIDLLREVAPPEYLRSETERIIRGLLSYLDQETDELDLYVDIGPPLENLEPAVNAYVDRRIDLLEEVDSGVVGCSPDEVERLGAVYLNWFGQLAEGNIPTQVPSIKALDQSCRSWLAESVIDGLDTVGGDEATALLSSAEFHEDLRQAFAAGDVKQVLKAAHSLSEPLIANAMEDIRMELTPDDRLDLISIFAEQQGIAEAEVRQGFAEFRTVVARIKDPGRVAALAAIAAGALIIGLLHLPNLAGVLRWPGITLLLSGAVCCVVGWVIHSQATEAVRNAVAQEPALVGDLAVSFSERLTAGYGLPAVIAMVAGALLLAASFAVPCLRQRLGGG